MVSQSTSPTPPPCAKAFWLRSATAANASNRHCSRGLASPARCRRRLSIVELAVFAAIARLRTRAATMAKSHVAFRIAVDAAVTPLPTFIVSAHAQSVESGLRLCCLRCPLCWSGPGARDRHLSPETAAACHLATDFSESRLQAKVADKPYSVVVSAESCSGCLRPRRTLGRPVASAGNFLRPCR